MRIGWGKIKRNKMNFLFSKNINYTSFESIEIVQSRFEELVGRKWHNLRNNLTGKKKSDGTYVFHPKWSLISLSTIFANAYLTVRLEEKENETIIRGTLRPTYILVFALYILVIWFLYELIKKTN